MPVEREYVGCVKRTIDTRRCVSRTLLLLTAVVVGGCGRGDRGPERVAVSGTVTYNGKPLSEGTIRFVPLPNCPVPTSGASIANGQYRLEGNDGVPVGTHKIQIEAFRIRVRRGEAPRRPGASGPANTSPTSTMRIRNWRSRSSRAAGKSPRTST